MKNGLFITFEGADGCGKTTQLNLLKEYLGNNGFEVITTREPGAKGLGEKLREILLNYDGEVSDRCESFLFLADRAQHIDTIVNPAINSGKIVLCDRHTDSTVAYQGYGRGLDINEIKMLNNIATKGEIPDLTFVFDVDIETSMKRVGKEKDRMESAGNDFFNKVRNGYLEIAKNEPNRVKVIDATKSIEEVFEQVINEYNKFIKKSEIKFSIILPTYNRGYCIENAIKSVLAQTHKNYELIISDDGSTDGTEELVKTKYKKEISDGIIKYIKTDKNSGQCHARNLGLELISSSWVAYLDSDNTIRPEFLSTFAAAIINNPDTKCFYSKFSFFNGENTYILGKEFDYDSLVKENFIDMGVFVHNATLIEKYGKFDTDLKTLEDWDLIIRYTKDNTPYFINDVLMDYIYSQDRVSNNGTYYDSLNKIRSKAL